MNAETVESVQEIVQRYSLTVPCIKEVATLLREALYRMVHLINLCEDEGLEVRGEAFLAHVKQINHLQSRAVHVLRDVGVSEQDTGKLIQQLVALLEAQESRE